MAAASVFKTKWADWSARFAALQQREKLLVVGATLFAILFGGYSLWIEPAQLQKARLTKGIAQQQTEEAQLTVQVATLTTQAADPDAANRAALQGLEQQLAAAAQDIRGFDRLLVAPAQAPALLQALLARHKGLSLVSLTTLAPQPLIPPPDEKKAKERNNADAGGNIYRHGIEIRIAGGYHDLLAYVDDLEKGAQKLVRGSMRLTAEYPVSELTLTVYTLSLESTWLVV